MTTKQGLDLSGVAGSQLFEKILHAGAVGAIELPRPLLKSITRASSLAAALIRSREVLADAQLELVRVRQVAVAEVLAGGPTAGAGAAGRAAERHVQDLDDDRAVIGSAAGAALSMIPMAFVDSYLALADQLARRLAELLGEARADADYLAGADVDWQGLPLLELSERQVGAFRRLEAIAVRTDAIRQAALAVGQDLARHDRHASERMAIARQLDLDASQRGKGQPPDGAWLELFVDAGGGLVGPARKLRNTGGTPAGVAYDGRAWSWAPSRWPHPHQVARLILSALDVPEAVPEPESESEPELPTRPTPRTPIKPSSGFNPMSRSEPLISHRNRPGR